MALVELDFRSHALGYHQEVVVILPDNPKAEKYPVLWLFHGANQDCTEWLRQTSIERYANKRGLAVVCPTVSDGHGMDMVHGMKYYTMLSEELPAAIHFMFPCLSTKREDNFTAGASMGGYVAYKLALNFPEKYCAAGGFASPLDILSVIDGFTKDQPQNHPFKVAFGSSDDIRGTKHDVIDLAGKLKKEGKLMPRLWSVVGYNDFGYPQVKGAMEKFKAANVEVTALYDEGRHGFDMWDGYIERFFDWLGLERV